MILGIEEGNKYIKELIKNNNPFSVTRIGLGGETLSSFYKDSKGFIPNIFINMLKNNAGFYGTNIDYFIEQYINGISSSDATVIWDSEFVRQAQTYLFNKYSKNSIKLVNRCIEPFYTTNPWTEELKGKKVLVIHPFSESILKQYDIREKLFNNDNILPKFDLKVYKSVQSIGDNKPHKDWTESFNVMKNDISNIDFDIALLGCGSYGLPLNNFIKEELHKSAIYIGGGLQILFGIKGKRWDNHNIIKEFYNEHWIYPSENEKPNNHISIEGGCYW